MYTQPPGGIDMSSLAVLICGRSRVNNMYTQPPGGIDMNSLAVGLKYSESVSVASLLPPCLIITIAHFDPKELFCGLRKGVYIRGSIYVDHSNTGAHAHVGLRTSLSTTSFVIKDWIGRENISNSMPLKFIKVKIKTYCNITSNIICSHALTLSHFQAAMVNPDIYSRPAKAAKKLCKKFGRHLMLMLQKYVFF